MTAEPIVYAQNFNRFELSYTPGTWAPPSRLEERIEERWAERKLPQNNTMFRINTPPRVENGVCYLDIGVTTYKDHLGTLDLPEWDNRANALFRSAFVITAPGHGDDNGSIVITRRKNVVRGAGEYGITAGGMPLVQTADNRPNIEDFAWRLVCSDLGLDHITGKLKEKIEKYGFVQKPFLIWGTTEEPAPSVADIIHLPFTYQELTQVFNSYVRTLESRGFTPKKDAIIDIEHTPKGVRELLNGYALRPLEESVFRNAEKLGLFKED